MLQKLRDKSSGWIATSIIVLLMIPFLFVIDSSYIGGVGNNNVARVQAPPTWWKSAPSFWPFSTLWQGGEVTSEQFRQRFEQLRMQAREQEGEAFDPREFESAENKRKVLDELINEQVIRLASDQAGIVIGPQAIADYIQQIPAFQRDGKFDQDQYRLVLSQGLTGARTPLAFQEQVRISLQQSVIPMALAQSGFVTPGESNRLFGLLGETRDIKLAVVDTVAADPTKVSAEQIKAWYETHAKDFRQPERIAVEYVVLDASALPAPVDADESVLRDRYEAEKSRFVATEQRKAAHILIAGDDASASAQAQSLADKARGGADFAALAKANSQDPGSKDLGGDLGWVEKGVMVGPFEDALFAMQAGEIRAVKSDFGWHVLKLEDIKGGQGSSFEQVRDQLAAEQRKADAENAFNALSTRLVDEVYKNPTALQPAATAAGLALQQVGPFSRDDAPPALANPLVLRQAFSEVMITDGTVSDPIEIAPGYSIVLRVTEHQPEAVLPLDKARERVALAVARDAADKAMKAKADALLARLVDGQRTLEEVAAEASLPVQALDALPRGIPIPGERANAVVFRTLAPAEGKVRHGQLVLDDGRHAVFALTRVNPGKAEAIPEQQRLMVQQQLTQIDGNAAADAFIKGLRKHYKVQVNESQL